MQSKKLIAGMATVAALAGGAAGAVAATGEKEAEQQILSDAAKRLGVSAAELRSALAAAEDAQLDAAVRAGELTQERADRIREHRQADGTVLKIGPGRHHGGPGGEHGGRRLASGPQLIQDAASALGLSSQQLFERLESGKTVGEIARAEGRSLAEVKSAVKATATNRLDAELKAGRITKAQHTVLVEHVDEHLDRLGEVTAFHGRGGHGPHDDGGSADDDDSTSERAAFRAA